METKKMLSLHFQQNRNRIFEDKGNSCFSSLVGAERIFGVLGLFCFIVISSSHSLQCQSHPLTFSNIVRGFAVKKNVRSIFCCLDSLFYRPG
jgi:hypothetical protein